VKYKLIVLCKNMFVGFTFFESYYFRKYRNRSRDFISSRSSLPYRDIRLTSSRDDWGSLPTDGCIRNALLVSFKWFDSLMFLLNDDLSSFINSIFTRSVLGYLTSWRWLSIASTIVPVIFAVGISFIPESPRYLLHRGYLEKATDSLIWLKSSNPLKPSSELTEELENVRVYNFEVILILFVKFKGFT